MDREFALATDSADVRAVQGLRYDVYVEEMGRYRVAADHDRRLLVEPEDESGFLAFVRDGDRLSAAARLTWGGGPGFSDRQIEQYRLQPFLDEIPAERMAVGERAMVRPELRGTSLLEELIEFAKTELEPLGVRVAFGACEPHLLPLYIARGQRPYADRNINTPEAGYLIPLVEFHEDLDSLLGVGGAVDDDGRPALPPILQRVLDSDGGAVTSNQLTAREEYLDELRDAFEQVEREEVSAFAGLTEEETRRCVERSNIIECRAGDRVLKQGGVARNMFVVLEGVLEARSDGGEILGVLSAGDTFGEVAFLLEQPRSLDVVAVTDPTRVLSLSEGTVRRMIAEDPVVAAKLLLNLSKMLCYRLLRTNPA